MVFAVAIVFSSLVIRNGLMAISRAIRDKPLPQWPGQIHLVAGDSKLNVNVANVSIQPLNGQDDLNMSIDNLRISPAIAPSTQPAK